MDRRRIIVRAPNWIGDQVMALPFYRGLRALYPQAHLTLLARPAVMDVPGTGGLFDDRRVLPVFHQHFPGGTWSAGRDLMVGRYDLAVCLPASLSSSFLFFAARIPVRVGFSEGGAGLFLTAHLPWQGRHSAKHKGALYLDLLSWLGGAAPPPVAAPSPSRREAFILVAPGASLPLREWPYYQELLGRLRRHFPDYRIRVVGSGADAKWHGFLRRLSLEGVEDWVGRTTLPELVVLTRQAALVIANDSGVAHVAATLGDAPTLVLFGPGDPRYVRPMGNAAVIRAESVACSPCESAVCPAPFGYQRCLREVTVDTVLERATQALSPSSVH